MTAVLVGLFIFVVLPVCAGAFLEFGSKLDSGSRRLRDREFARGVESWRRLGDITKGQR